jgi:hypothetical protein
MPDEETPKKSPTVLGGAGKIVTGAGGMAKAAAGALWGAGAGAGMKVTNWALDRGAEAVNSGMWIFLSVALYLSDIFYTRFDGIDWTLFVSRFTSMGVENVVRIFGNAVILVIMILYYIFNKPDMRDFVSFFILVEITYLILFFGNITEGFYHILFVFLLYIFLIRPLSVDKAQANYITALLLFLDFFGYGLLSHYTRNSLLANRLVLPIWFYYTLALTHEQKRNWFSSAIIVVVVVLNVVYVSTGLGMTQDLSASLSEQERAEGIAYWRTQVEKARELIKETYEGIVKGTQKKLEYASGGYYEGEVEKGEKEPLGVYMEDIKAADKQFYEDESVTIWATLRVMNLDEENPVEVRVNCTANKGTDKPVDGEVFPKGLFKIYSLEEEDLQCKFAPGELEKGYRKVSMAATFNFETMAYLKSYFIDQERLRSMRRDDIDVFSHFGITDVKPVARYTNGPVKIGIESKEPPIGLSAETDTMPLLGVTLGNQWEGAIKKINDLIVYIPASMELDLYSCDSAFERYPSKDIREETGEGHIAYRLSGSEASKQKYQNIKDYVSFRCRLIIKPEKIQEILGGVPFATKFFRVTADYQYSLEKTVSANVVRAPGFNVQLRPARATVKDNIKCIGTHDTKYITKVDYKFTEITESGERVIHQGQKPGGVQTKSFEVDLHKDRLKAEGISKGARIRCTMDATLYPESKESDSGIILIRNTPPEINVRFEEPTTIEKDLKCRGNVTDADGDLMRVDWEISNGHFDDGSCGMQDTGDVCEAIIPKRELSVGERITCRMTPTDGEHSGAEKSDTTVISK